MKTVEVNFDGLVGPTHAYSGLALGNVASKKNIHTVSYPLEAALQGLKKMRVLQQLGIPQGVLPPHERPFFPVLRKLGFQGSDEKILQEVFNASPQFFWDIYSASSMWAANCATVSPSVDTHDKKVHFTPANLFTFFHRAIETETTKTILERIFNDPNYFIIHDPLPRHSNFSDEGAANHHRFCKNYNDPGFHLFAYGRAGESVENLQYPARQALQASQAIARLHQLPLERCFFIKQNLGAIQQGVFHNDVISVGNENVFLYHLDAFQDIKSFEHFIQTKLQPDFYCIPISSDQITVTELVRSYLFNSQIVTISENNMAIIVPKESAEGAAKAVLEAVLAIDNPIKTVHFVDCHQSMLNGGGPACLRLRVVLTEAELKACHQGVFLTDALYERLVVWVKKHYRDRLYHEDLRDPSLLRESQEALDELTAILGLGSIYHFQKYHS